MREIKFRGKSKANGAWRIGDLIHRGVDVWIRPHINEFAVDASTVGQFIGLYDRNGKEIYEGDIVRSIVSDRLYEVEYDTRFASFGLKRKDKDEPLRYFGDATNADGCEIIGSKYGEI